MKTKQIEFWKGNFGREYTDRNFRNRKEWEDLYVQQLGVSKIHMNNEFIGFLPRNSKILEVGCNAGMQLRGLQQMGFKDLFGIEVLSYAAKKAKDIESDINIIIGSGFEIPFKDKSFDVVCTSVVLIHIAPPDLDIIMREMLRCTKKYIWGFEYYSKKQAEINYRGNEDVLWKADFAELFLEKFPELKLVKNKLYPYVRKKEAGNVDCMYLLVRR